MILALPQFQHYANSSFRFAQFKLYAVLYVLSNDIHTALCIFGIPLLYVINRFYNINIRHYAVRAVTYIRFYQPC